LISPLLVIEQSAFVNSDRALCCTYSLIYNFLLSSSFSRVMNLDLPLKHSPKIVLI